MNFYLSQNGQQLGPYTSDQIRQFYQQGSISLDDYLCHDNVNWVLVRESEWLTGINPQITVRAIPRKQNLVKRRRQSTRHKNAISNIKEEQSNSGEKAIISLLIAAVVYFAVKFGIKYWLG